MKADIFNVFIVVFSSDPLGDTASNLGNAMDELMRHQPSLKTAATGAIIKLLEEVCALGRDPKYICWKTTPSTAKTEANGTNNGVNNGVEAANGGGKCFGTFLREANISKMVFFFQNCPDLL